MPVSGRERGSGVRPDVGFLAVTDALVASERLDESPLASCAAVVPALDVLTTNHVTSPRSCGRE